MSNRVQLTAWGNEEYKAMLDNIMKKKGYRSMSEAILALIADENDRQNGKDNVDDSLYVNMVKMVMAFRDGEIETLEEGVKMLKGGNS